jgi:hypothetical protein
MSKSALSLKCSNDDLRSFVEDFIEQSDFYFTFNSLCLYIVSLANQKDLFVKESNVEYSEIELNGIDIKRINLIIWDKIWDRKIIIDFSKDKYQSSNDYRFMKMDK